MQQYFSLYLIYKPFNKNVIRLNYKITLLSSTIFAQECNPKKRNVKAI